MNIAKILFAILLPVCLSLVFSLMNRDKTKASKKMTDENFTVMIPGVVASLGAISAVVAAGLMLLFTFFSDETPHWLCYLFFGSYFLFGVYLVIWTKTFKVVVKGEEITVFPTFKKPYTFTFSEIVLAVRQVKKNQVKSERIVIRTSGGKKLIVERAEISYKRFRKLIELKVESERLIGFD